MDTIVLDGNSLTIEQVVAVASGAPGDPRVVIGDAARARVARAADAVAQLLDEGRVVYGITTGFGAFKNRVIPKREGIMPALIRTALTRERPSPGAYHSFDNDLYSRASLLEICRC